MLMFLHFTESHRVCYLKSYTCVRKNINAYLEILSALKPNTSTAASTKKINKLMHRRYKKKEISKVIFCFYLNTNSFKKHILQIRVKVKNQ